MNSIETQRIELEKIYYSHQWHVNPQLMGIELKLDFDYRLDYMVMSLVKEVWATREYPLEEQTVTLEILTPKTWVDFFLEAHQSHWLIKQIIKHRPIQYQTHQKSETLKTTGRYTFPDLVLPNQQHVIKYQLYHIKDNHAN